MATRYLIEHGHTQIAFVSGSIRENGVNNKRYRGYCEAMAEAGLPVRDEALYLGEVSFDYGMQAAREYVARGRKQTAALATADVVAFGMAKGLHEAGVRVPQELSLVGFDDVYLARMCVPSLTTVHQDIAAKGREAVEAVLTAVSAGEKKKLERILPLSIVERDSVLDRRE